MDFSTKVALYEAQIKNIEGLLQEKDKGADKAS